MLSSFIKKCIKLYKCFIDFSLFIFVFFEKKEKNFNFCFGSLKICCENMKKINNIYGIIFH